MKYILELMSRVDESESVLDKHKQMIKAMHSVGGIWGIKDNSNVDMPNFGKDIFSVFSLNGKLGTGIKGSVYYRFRNLIIDHHSCDDRIWIEFNTKKVIFPDLVNSVMPLYITHFNAYKASLYPEELIYLATDMDASAKAKLNRRKEITFFYPFQFFDSKAIESIFYLTPDEFYSRLKPRVYKIEKNNNGVYIFASDNFLDLDQTLAFNDLIQKILGLKLPRRIAG